MLSQCTVCLKLHGPEIGWTVAVGFGGEPNDNFRPKERCWHAIISMLDNTSGI